MDIVGGKGICLGPSNFLARGYQGSPIAVTVEGANILTRSMIIFGQGAIRCHPYVLTEMDAAHSTANDAVDKFDKALAGHVSFTISNLVRSFWLGLTDGSWFINAAERRNKTLLSTVEPLQCQPSIAVRCVYGGPWWLTKT